MPVRALESESSAYPSFATDAYTTTMELSNNLQHNIFQICRTGHRPHCPVPQTMVH